MASNKPVRFGPVALTVTTTTNILNPPTLTGGTGLSGTNSATFLLLRHIRITNKTNAVINTGLWLGATGANTSGTECFAAGTASAGALTAGTGFAIAANSAQDFYGALRLDTADFLVGGAAAVGCTIEGEGEIGIV
jgi:hypothetical protein